MPLLPRLTSPGAFPFRARKRGSSRCTCRCRCRSPRARVVHPQFTENASPPWPTGFPNWSRAVMVMTTGLNSDADAGTSAELCAAAAAPADTWLVNGEPARSASRHSDGHQIGARHLRRVAHGVAAAALIRRPYTTDVVGARDHHRDRARAARRGVALRVPQLDLDRGRLAGPAIRHRRRAGRRGGRAGAHGRPSRSARSPRRPPSPRRSGCPPSPRSGGRWSCRWLWSARSAA